MGSTCLDALKRPVGPATALGLQAQIYLTYSTVTRYKLRGRVSSIKGLRCISEALPQSMTSPLS